MSESFVVALRSSPAVLNWMGTFSGETTRGDVFARRMMSDEEAMGKETRHIYLIRPSRNRYG